MIDNVRNFHFYKNGNKFYGSHEGMRFAIETQKSDEETHLYVDTWPDRFSRDKTSEEQHFTNQFDFSQDGLDKAKVWLGEIYDEKKNLWDWAIKTPFVQTEP